MLKKINSCIIISIMAGGMFGRPFVLNIKCIVFSLLIMTIFLYKPNITNNYVMAAVLLGIFVVAYVAMAWYDYYYDCRILPLKRGEKSVTGLLKPPTHMPEQTEKAIPKRGLSRHALMVYLSHIIFIVPLLIYIAVYRKKINPITYPLIGALALFTLTYHGFELMSGVH
jgi:hypothetical protein